MTKHESTNGQNPVLDPFLALWSSYLEQSNQQTAQMMEAMRQATDPLAFRKKWFEAVSASLDGFLRSNVFLDSLKQQSEVVNFWKSLMNQATEEAVRGMGLPHESDIRFLVDSLRSFENRVLERLDALEARLAAQEEESKVGSEAG